MNTFPHQERADRSLRPGARTLRRRHSILVQVAGMAYAVLPSVRSRTTRATTWAGVDLGRAAQGGARGQSQDRPQGLSSVGEPIAHRVYGARRCVGQLAAPTLSEPLSRFAPQRAHSSYFWPSSFHFQRQSCISSKHLSGFFMAQSLARPRPLARTSLNQFSPP
jgi:hypothetical protein